MRLAPLIRPLVQAKWASRVAARNPDLIDAERLNVFLFGAQRISLARVHGPLADAQDRQCFYCSDQLTKSWDIDHFLPWSRHPDNTLDNMVAAHARCNGAKSASLAGTGHLRRWIERFTDTPAGHRVEDVSRSTGWPRRSDRVLSAARATYLWLLLDDTEDAHVLGVTGALRVPMAHGDHGQGWLRSSAAAGCRRATALPVISWPSFREGRG